VSHLRLDLPSGLFPRGFAIKTLYKLTTAPTFRLTSFTQSIGTNSTFQGYRGRT
jgi:hypothetical protein